MSPNWWLTSGSRPRRGWRAGSRPAPQAGRARGFGPASAGVPTPSGERATAVPPPVRGHEPNPHRGASIVDRSAVENRQSRRSYAWAQRGDINAFFGLMLDNIGVMILMASLLVQ